MWLGDDINYLPKVCGKLKVKIYSLIFNLKHIYTIKLQLSIVDSCSIIKVWQMIFQVLGNVGIVPIICLLEAIYHIWDSVCSFKKGFQS